jgi:ATP dependent DNA ligase domain
LAWLPILPICEVRSKRLPAGFIIPAQPVMASRPPSGADWVHEIKHDGYRMIVRRDDPAVRLYTGNAYDWTARLPAIAAAAQRIKAKSFTIDGEVVVVGPDGLSRFDELRRRPQRVPRTLCIRFDRARWQGSSRERARAMGWVLRVGNGRRQHRCSKEERTQDRTTPDSTLQPRRVPAVDALFGDKAISTRQPYSSESVPGLLLN